MFLLETLFSFVMRHKLAPGAKLMVNEADRSRALKSLTHLKLAPGAKLTVQGADDLNLFMVS